MRPGKLKRRITINRPTTITDEMGGAEETLTLVGNFYAEINRGGGSRSLEYEQTQFSRPFFITIRENIDILESDIITFEGKTLIVSSVDRDFDFFRYQTITATEKFKG